MIELPPPFAFPLHPPAIAGHGRRLGNFELLDELATGRSFRLDLAVADNGNVVALKRLRGESAHARSRLLREAHVATSLCVPNLLRAYELLHEPEPALALEYVRGATLRQLLANAQPNDLRHALTAYLGALRGLASLHAYRDAQGSAGYLVHQAPVARHMLVGVDGVARLIDLSHLRGSTLGDCEGADQGLVLSELAPEQIQARDALDPRCDVFVAGATLRELIARCRVTQRTPLDDVWRRAMATRRTERYLSAHELSYAVGRAAQRAGLLCTPEELGQWVSERLHAERPSGNRPPPLPRPASAPPPDAWVEHAPAPAADERTSFVPPRVSFPRALPSAERMSSVWYSIAAQPGDDDVVKAIAAAKPLGRPSQSQRGVDLRSLGSGVTLGCIALCGLVAMGASPQGESTSRASAMSPRPVVASAGVVSAPVVPAPTAAPAQPPPVPAVTSLAAPAPRLVPQRAESLREEPRQRSERAARHSQARPKPRVQRPRELIRMTGSVPENPF